MERFEKMVNGWTPLIVFAKGLILDVWLGFEHVSDYLGVFSIIVNWNYHFEPSKHFSDAINDHQANVVNDIDPVTNLKLNLT